MNHLVLLLISIPCNLSPISFPTKSQIQVSYLLNINHHQVLNIKHSFLHRKATRKIQSLFHFQKNNIKNEKQEKWESKMEGNFYLFAFGFLTKMKGSFKCICISYRTAHILCRKFEEKWSYFISFPYLFQSYFRPNNRKQRNLTFNLYPTVNLLLQALHDCMLSELQET